MSNLRDMIDAIADENFIGARSALKTSLAEYMAGRRYVSNEDVFGYGNTNPNTEAIELSAELTEGSVKEELLGTVHEYIMAHFDEFLSPEDMPLDDDYPDVADDVLEKLSDKEVQAIYLKAKKASAKKGRK